MKTVFSCSLNLDNDECLCIYTCYENSHLNSGLHSDQVSISKLAAHVPDQGTQCCELNVVTLYSNRSCTYMIWEHLQRWSNNNAITPCISIAQIYVKSFQSEATFHENE